MHGHSIHQEYFISSKQARPNLTTIVDNPIRGVSLGLLFPHATDDFWALPSFYPDTIPIHMKHT